jgi:hypothetical protein
VTPFLHRRKMKSNRRQWKYKAGELVPLGSEVSCYVHEVDASRNRVGLTTYPPEQWAERLLPPATGQKRYAVINVRTYSPSSSYMPTFNLIFPVKPATVLYRQNDYSYGEDGEDFDPIPFVGDNEELGGDVRAANLRALRRTLALQLDEDADEGGNGEDDADGSDDDDEAGEVLSKAEVRRLTADRRTLADDYDGANREDATDEAADSAALAKAARNKASALGEDQYTTDELFESLSNRKPFLTLSDVKKWDYARLLIQDGSLTVPVLQCLFQRAGAVRGQLGPGKFGLFLDLFADELGLAEDDGSFVDEEAELFALGAPAATKDPTSSVTVRSHKKLKFAIDDFAEAVASIPVVKPAPGSTTAEKRSARKQDKQKPSEYIELPDGLSVSLSQPDNASPPRAMQTLTDALFETFAKGKPHVDFETLVQKWDTLRTLIARDGGNAVRLRQSFAECAKASKVKGHVDAAGFARFVDGGVSAALTTMQVSSCLETFRTTQ